ncbi:MAG: hypothetical protein LBL17_01365 [Coxiellaceae bacterium]|nr:hypothetical protein [Coxiellaceae bacterium]
MQDFISTDTTILITLLCKNIPNLYHYITAYSTSGRKGKKHTQQVPILSAQQIYEARMHASTVVRQVLNSIATIQGAINTVDNKIDKLVKQRKLIESTLLALLSMTNQG